MRIAPLSDAIPIPFDTVAGKLGSVVRETNVDVPPIAKRIIDTVRDDHALGPTWEVMVERLEGSAATNSARANASNLADCADANILVFTDLFTLPLVPRERHAKNVFLITDPTQETMTIVSAIFRNHRPEDKIQTN